MLANVALLMEQAVGVAQQGVQAGGQMAGQMGRQAGEMMRGGPGMHGGGFFWGGLGTAVVWAGIILLVLWIVRNWSNPNNRVASFLRGLVTNVQSTVQSTVQPSTPVTSSGQSALEVLQSRYAKGEISREEYQTIRRDLVGEVAPVALTETATAPESPVQA
jgi:hypothetical protein